MALSRNVKNKAFKFKNLYSKQYPKIKINHFVF